MRRRVLGVLIGISFLLLLVTAEVVAGVWCSCTLTVPRFGGEPCTTNVRKRYTAYASVSARSVGKTTPQCAG
jgi:hypothetical protein